MNIYFDHLADTIKKRSSDKTEVIYVPQLWLKFGCTNQSFYNYIFT